MLTLIQATLLGLAILCTGIGFHLLNLPIKKGYLLKPTLPQEFAIAGTMASALVLFLIATASFVYLPFA